MTTKHTPGPWVIRERTGRLHITPADNEFFMCAAASGFNQAEAQANARLIAASPDLLAALEAALPQIQRFRCTDPNGETCDNPVLQQARAAIAKAKGE